jgi:dimethylglycine dehydrogenase
MRNEAKVVVIGGGGAGCSVLYHLTKLGWTDVMLVEENELTEWLDVARGGPVRADGF